MSLPRIIRADFGSDLAIQEKYNFTDKLAGFLTLARPIFLLMTPLNAASAAVLANSGLPSWQQCLAGFFTGACAAAGVNIFNKFTDAERDKIIWPQRSIPSGRVKPWQALALSILFYCASLALCWTYFNPTAFWLLLSAEVLGSLYSSHLRDRIGYLSLPPIEGLIFLTGWAALAPATVFATVVPWYLYLLGVVWQSAHILAHYALNIRYVAGDKPLILTPAFFGKPSARTAARATALLTFVLVLMALSLPWLAPLGYIYIVPVALCGLFTLFQCRTLWKASLDSDSMHRAWSSLSLLRMVISLATIVDVIT